MKNGLTILIVSVTLWFSAPALSVPFTQEMLEEKMDSSRWALCNQPPLEGKEAVNPKLVFHDFRQTELFLTTLSDYVYQFDRVYLLAITDSLKKSNDQDLVSIFAMNALAPYLRGLGYTELKRRYVDPAMENLTCLNRAFGIETLDSLKNIVLFQEFGLQMLLQSLNSSRTLYSEPQKAKAAKLTEAFAEVLAQKIGPTTLPLLHAQKAPLSEFLNELTGNPFLRSRAATDLTIAKLLID